MPDQLSVSLKGSGALPELLRGLVKANLIHHLAHTGDEAVLRRIGRRWRPAQDWLPEEPSHPSQAVVDALARLCAIPTGKLAPSDLEPLRRLAESDPAELWAWVGLGLSALRIWGGDEWFRRSREWLGRAAALRPGWAWGPLLVGEAQRSLLDYEGASKSYRAALALDPALAWGWAFESRVRFQSGTKGSDLPLMDRALRLSPREGWMHAWRAEGLRRLGRAAAAERAFARALELDPLYDQAYAWRAKLLLSQGRPAEAVKSLRRGLALCPDFEKAWRPLVAALRGLGRVDEALDALERAAALNHRNGWLGPWRVEGWSASEETDAALSALAGRTDARARAWRGEALSQLGRQAEALKELDGALEARWARAWRGEALLRLGRRAEALKDLEAAVAEDPLYGRAWAWLGRARLDEGDAAGALEALTRAVTARRIEYAWVYAWRAEALLALDRKESALADLDAAIGLDPGCAAFRRLRGKALIDGSDLRRGCLDLLRAEEEPLWRELAEAEEDRLAGRFKDAGRRLSRLAASRREGFLHLLRYRLRREAGLPGALRDVDAAFRRDPGCGWLFGLSPLPEGAPLPCALLQDAAFAAEPAAGPAWAYHGLALAQAGRPQESLAALEKAAALEPAGWILAWLGEGLRKAGRVEEALAALERAVAADPSYANAWLWRGAALRLAGRPEEGEAALDRGLRLRPTARGLLERARCRLARGRAEAALDDVERAAGLDWELSWEADASAQLSLARGLADARARAWEGDALNRLGRPKEALAALAKARGPLACAFRARALLALGRAEEALSPARDPRGLVVRAEALLALGRPEEALFAAKKVLASQPYSARVHLLRARAHAACGQRREARAACERALRLRPGFKDALELARAVEPGPRLRGEGKSLEFFINYACNAKCGFCFNPPDASPELERGLPFEELSRRLYEGWREGYREVKFIGGEPTVREDFPRLIALARTLGYRPIQLTTNGVRLGDEAYARRLVALGVDRVRFSIHGHTPALHDGLVGVPGALKRIERAGATLRRLGVPVGVNVVVNAVNARALPELVEYLWERLGTRDAILYFLRFQGHAELPANRERLALRMSEAVPFVREAFRRLSARGHKQMPALIHFPPCALPELSAHMLDWSREGVGARLSLPDGTDGVIEEVTNSGKTQFSACGACALKGRCFGVERRYLALFGESEFVPVGAAEAVA